MASKTEKISRNGYEALNKECARMKTKYSEDIYEQLVQRWTFEYLDKYIDDVRRDTSVQLAKNKNVCIDGSVFTLWLQGIDNAPPIVKSCVSSLSRMQKELLILNEKNISEYISLPDYIWQKYEAGIIDKAHFSDIVRLYLLETYGGVWADATCYVCRKPPEYMTEGLWVFKQNPQQNQVRTIGNWWISSHRGDELIRLMRVFLCTYWEKENELVHYFLFHIMWMKITQSYEGMNKKWSQIYPRYTDTTHYLALLKNEVFTPDLWDEMKSITPVFKCTHHYNEKIGCGSYYDLLEKNMLP